MNPCAPVSACRCCGGGRLESVLDMGDMPLANDFHNGEARPRFPLHLLVCQDCWHGQLSVAVPGEALFRHYAYLSGGSRTFRDHCRQLVAAALGLVSVPGGRPAVLDIACNDGTLLSLFRDAGCDVMGVEPARNLKRYTDRLGMPVVNAFWGTDAALALGRKFDVITAQNVLAHVPDPGDFLAGCAACLNAGGVVLVEFPYSLEMVTRNEFDTVYHEHLSYFSVNSFARLVGRSPFHIADVTRLSVHGGSLRFTLRKGPGPHTPAVGDLLQDEQDAGMFRLSTYREFRERVGASRTQFRALVAGLRAVGEKMIGYGASAKGVTMLNHFDVELDYVVDDTELKQGRLIPGRTIPVVGPEVLRREPGRLNIVVLAWNWLAEIRERVRSLRGDRDNLLLYVPGVYCCDLAPREGVTA
jgi:SAM-dependent methyltransferase